jgi:NAD(P)-dependent dehydrogenase (short-subunit alcohol dehydrogenase family)
MEAFGRIDHLVNNAAIFGNMELAGLTTVDLGLEILSRFGVRSWTRVENWVVSQRCLQSLGIRY